MLSDEARQAFAQSIRQQYRDLEAQQRPSSYRWVEPETVIVQNGERVVIPAHQEEGQYAGESSLPGYVVVMWNGRLHLVHEQDIVAILS